MAAIGPGLVSPEDGDILISPSLPQPATAQTEVECSADLIQQIRAETVDAFMRLPHGGLEIAGVFFGTKLGHTLHITASRAIGCEHARGPSLTLSDRDQGELERMLTEAREDPALNGLEPLGWYVSHTRRPFALVESDVAVFDRFFPEPLCVTAVVRPETSGTAHFRVFVRNEDGSIDSQRPWLEFTAHPEPGKLRNQPPPLTEEQPVQKDPAPGKARSRHRAVPFEAVIETQDLRRPSASKTVWIGATSLLLCILAAALWWFQSQPQAGRPLPLRVTETGQQLRIDWNPAADVVQGAASGVLEIKDLGDSRSPVRLNLGPEILQSGSVLYSKPSDKVSIRLQLVDRKHRISESMVYFLARETAAPKMQVEKPPEKTVANAIQPGVERRDAVASVEPQAPPQEPPSPTIPLRKFRQPPKSASKLPAPEPVAVEAPRMPITPSQPSAPLVDSLRSEVPPAPPAISEKPRTDVPKTRSTASSGRLIWTGELHKGAVLKITGRGASTGVLNGMFPGGPIKVSVHAAELLDGAIAIYTSDPNARQSAEAPSRRNGWNVTMYKWDPKRAHDVAVVEPPTQANDWKQLVLKSGNRTTSIIVIDWQQMEH